MTNSTNPHPPGPVSEALAACAHAINRFHLAYPRARDAEDQCEVRRGPGYKPPRPPAHDLQIGEVRGHDGLLLWRQARADAHRARRAMDDVGRDACDRISAAGAAARALELDAKDLDDLLELLDQIAGRITARNIPHATEHDQGYHDLLSKFARWRRRIARYERLLPSSPDAAAAVDDPAPPVKAAGTRRAEVASPCGPVARALGVLVEFPELKSIRSVALKAKCSHSTLSRSRRFQAAWRHVQRERSGSLAVGYLQRGADRTRRGAVEAIDPDGSQ